MKKFDKKSLDYNEQIELLKDRGLIIENEQEAINFLKYTNYYRLSSYMRHYQVNSNHILKRVLHLTILKTCIALIES